MPPEGTPRGSFSEHKQWATVSDAAAELGVEFPPYFREGCYFRLREDRHHDADNGSRQSETLKVMARRLVNRITNPAMIVPTDIISLPTFTRALRNFVRSPAYMGVIDFADVLKFV